jgi:hypothetical protein
MVADLTIRTVLEIGSVLVFSLRNEFVVLRRERFTDALRKAEPNLLVDGGNNECLLRVEGRQVNGVGPARTLEVAGNALRHQPFCPLPAKVKVAQVVGEPIEEAIR